MNKLLISILLLMSSALYGQINTMVPFKLLKAEGIKLESYYLKADQSSEIAQTRYHRGLYLMSELSALRARLQFEKADNSIDEYVSKVAGTNLSGVLPWNRKKYKQELMDDALKLRFSLARQDEDLEALLKEIQQQLAKSNSVSAQKTLERIDDLIIELMNKSKNASPEERDQFLEFANEKGVMTRPIWTLMNRLPMFKQAECGNLKNSEWLYDHVVNIPSSII